MTLGQKRNLIRNKNAVNAVISNLILISAVIVVGFAVLGWAQTQSTQYQKTQAGIINQDISQLQERLSFEYISYNGSTLKVYIMNSGTNNNVTVSRLQIDTNLPMITVDKLYLTNGTIVSGLKIGQDGYFTANTILTQGTTYSIKIITSRGSSFVTNFAY